MSSLAEEPLAPPQISTMETPLTPVREYLKEDKGRVEHHLIPVFDSSANGAAASDSPEVKKKDNSFFDATSQRWVLVNDFAFPEDENHFEKIERMQATQDLNPSLSSDTSSALLLDSETLNNNINAFQIQPGDDEMEFEKLFNLEIVEEDFSRPPNTQHQPKIVSPKEEQQQPSQVLSRPLRKLSDELGSLCLPSRSNPNTPRECQEDARLPGDESEPTSNAELTCLSKSSPSPPLFLKQGRKSAIPRYVRNTGSLSNSSQRSKSFSPSPVEKRVRQQRAPLSEDKMNPLTTRNLNRQKSRSAANLAAAESNIGLLSNRSNSKSEGNLPSLKVSASTASSKKANYSHVKSKVREYIAKVKNLPSKRHPPQNDDRESLVQQQQQSFLLSPGRKALSMSNLVSENKDASNSTSECKSVTNLTKMKAFLSSNHLDDFQITLSNSCGGGLNRSSRNSLSTFDRTRICRLLDNLSDSDEALVDDHPAAAEGCEDVSFDVEDVLILAMEERKEKKEAEKVLSQLQSNYDVLQRKYAEAENKIDKLRFGSDRFLSDNMSGLNIHGAGTNNNNHGSESTSQFIPSSYLDNISTLLIDTKSSNNSSFIHVNNNHGVSKINDGGPTSCVSGGRNQQKQLDLIKRKRLSDEVIVFQSKARVKLNEIEEQLFGLELLSDLSSSERLTAIKEIKAIFESVLQESTVISGCPDLAEASPEDTGLDPSFISLLKAVGKKLYELELSQQMYVRDSSAKIEAPPTPTLETVAMDPIEKVEKWQQSDLHLGSPAKEYTGLPSATSCYGSLPPSPTMETSTPCKGPHQHPLTAISPTPHEHDSGYPGSDRSAMRLQLLSLHKQGSTSSSYSGGRKPLILSNVEEERAAASTNNLKNECTSATSRKTTGKRAASMHTTYLNSVTDLSSDERSMFDTKVDDNHLREEKVDGTEEDDEHYPIVPEKYQQPLVALTPGSTSGSRQRQQQPMILATQIDQEIMELRNFFEDHREEMMTLIQENSQELIFPPIDSAITPRRKQRLKARKYEIEQMLSAESGTDFEMERRQEFEKRRRAKKRKDAAAMMINQQQYFHHKQQQQEGLHLQQHHSAIVPDFAIGQQQPNQNQEQQKISAFFPNVDPGLTASGPYSSRHGGGTEVDSAQGPIFIPKLPLDDLWTEKSGDERFCDPRSFDFNQSLASIPSLAQNEEVHPKIAKPGRPKSCERTKSTRTNYGPEIHQQQQSIQVRSQSVADLLHQNPGNSPPNVVIVHSCCRHSSTDRSDRNGSGSSCTNRGRKSSSSNSHHLKEGHKKRGGSSNRKKTKAKMEMKALLATLEQANQMAKALRERSQDIVQVLGQEIQTMKET